MNAVVPMSRRIYGQAVAAKPANTYPEVAARLREARDAAGLTQEEVWAAFRDGDRPTSLSSIQRWEYTGSLKFEDARMWALITRVSLDWLGTGVTSLDERDASAQLPSRDVARVEERVKASKEAVARSQAVRRQAQRSVPESKPAPARAAGKPPRGAKS